jgi:hypothetical protein
MSRYTRRLPPPRATTGDCSGRTPAAANAVAPGIRNEAAKSRTRFPGRSAAQVAREREPSGCLQNAEQERRQTVAVATLLPRSFRRPDAHDAKIFERALEHVLSRCDTEIGVKNHRVQRSETSDYGRSRTWRPTRARA